MDAFRWTLLLEVIFVVTAMTFIGLSVTWKQATGLLREKKLIIRALIANLLLAPLLALALVAIFEMPRGAQVALILLSVAPGGLNVLQFTTKIGGRLASAAALLFVLSIISLLSTPLGILFMPLAREPNQITALSHVLVFTAAALAPLALGGFVRRHAAELAEKLVRPMSLISTTSFVAAMVMSSSIKKQAAEVLSATVLLVLILFVAGTWLIGWAMGSGEAADRRMLATTTSIRNAGLVLLFAITLFPNTGVDSVVLAYALIMIVPNAAIMIAHSLGQKRRDHKAAHTPKTRGEDHARPA